MKFLKLDEKEQEFDKIAVYFLIHNRFIVFTLIYLFELIFAKDI